MRALPALLAFALACGSTPSASRPDYFRWIGFRGRGHEMMALRWLDHQMPLAVYLPQPPDGMFEDPDGIFAAVREGVTGWSGVASLGVPSFTFIDDRREADIRVEWAPESDGSWYVAFCSYNGNIVTRTLAVERILVSARWPNGRVADPVDLRATMLHEMGHALGLGGHSPNAGDIMYASVGPTELSERDRNTLGRLYSVGNGRTIAGGKQERR